jgi:hypothetical protein
MCSDVINSERHHQRRKQQASVQYKTFSRARKWGGSFNPRYFFVYISMDNICGIRICSIRHEKKKLRIDLIFFDHHQKTENVRNEIKQMFNKHYKITRITLNNSKTIEIQKRRE